MYKKEKDNVLDQSQLQYFVFKGNHPPKTMENKYNLTYLFWKDVWMKDRNESNVEGPLFSKDFTRQDEILALFYKDECIGITLLKWFNASQITTQDDANFYHWPASAMKALSRDGEDIISGSYFAISENFRRQRFGISWKDLMVTMMVKRFKHSEASALGIMPRVKKGMGKVAEECGGTTIKFNHPYHIEGEMINLVGFYKKDLIGKELPSFNNLVNDLWNKKKHFGLPILREDLDMKLKLQRLFSEILTEDEIICDIEKYKRNTINLKRDILICLRPTRKEKVVSIVKIANEHNIKLSPISSGNNWGYGSSLPATNDNVILDLSLLNSIIEFNEDLGFIRIGPGLTQGQLYKYLEDNNHNYLVPTTGAGPTCSILGNLLERGYGPTPHQDHFASLHSIEAVLGNGKIYKSPLRKIAGNMLDNIFRGGIGPYLDGIFTQSNYAIVTEATISLVKRPEEVEVFVLELHDKDDLQNIVKDIRSLITQLGGIVGAVNLMNNRRVLSMQTAYVSESDGKNILTDLEIQELAKKEGVCEWTVIGSFYKNKEINKASRKLTQRILKKKNRKLHFFTDRKARLIRKFVSILPDLFFKKFKSKFNGLLNNLIKLIEIFNGKPSKLALPLCYLKKSETPDMNGEINPAQDECGLIWYSPLVPMIPEKISEYVSFVEKVCGKYGIEPLITFTSVSEKCFDSTVPILFKRDKSEVDETAKAHSCYDELLEEGKKLGFYPYRMGINHMSSVVDMEDTFWQLGSDIKSIIDPNEIISPGRYSLK